MIPESAFPNEQVEELKKWREAVLSACAEVGIDPSSHRYDARVVVTALVARNVQLVLAMAQKKAPEHTLTSYEHSDNRTLKQITTEKPTTAEEHRSVTERRVNARRQIEDRRMEKDLYKKFGE